MSENERDTRFAGFAKLLWDELVQLNEYGYIDVSDCSDDGIDPIDYRKLIAQRAFDLVYHDHMNVEHIDLDRLTLEEQVAKIPDLAKWPEH